MILTDKEILKHMDQKTIVVEPFRPECMGTNSYDVHLGATLALYTDDVLDSKKHNAIAYFTIPEGFCAPTQ